MQLIVKWRNATHFLLENPSITLKVDGVTATTVTKQTGSATFDVPLGSASPPIATLTVKFAPTFTGRATETLQIEQHFELQPPGLFGSGGPQPTSYTIRPTGSATSVVQIGRHPLLALQISALDIWYVFINTNTVDVTNIQVDPANNRPLLLSQLNKLARAAPNSNVRVLARTDGELPFHWITATPATCTSFANTDVLCFLTPPQGSPQDRDDTDLLVTSSGIAQLAARLAIFLADGLHDDTLTPRERDHFARAHNPSDIFWRNQPKPSVVLPRGWESALVTSGKHVTMVLPVPSGGAHNGAETASLPRLLSDIYSALVAIGDIAAPGGSGITRPLRLGIAAHSNGGGALFSAVAASPKAFQEIWLFDTNHADLHLSTLARTTAGRVLFAGFDKARVIAPHNAAKKMPSLSGRVPNRLPDLPESLLASNSPTAPAMIAATSPKLKHALVEGGMVAKVSDWAPGVVVLPTGENFIERFEVLHQQIVQGNDTNGLHYLTKALRDSVFT